jgi:hypothetical protein
MAVLSSLLLFEGVVLKDLYTLPPPLPEFLTCGDVCVSMVFCFAGIFHLRLFLPWRWSGDLPFIYAVIFFISCSGCQSCNSALS